MPRRLVSVLALAALFAAVLAAVLAAPGVAAPRYRVVDLGLASGTEGAMPHRFGHDGSLLGWSDVAGTFGGHATRWTLSAGGDPLAVTDLGGLPAFDWSFASGANASGWIVGNSNTADPQPRAVLWRDGQVIDIERGADGNANVYATDVNDAGTICGFMTKSGGGGSWDAVIWTEQANHPGRFDRVVLPLHPSADTAFGWTEAQEILENGVVFGRQALNPGDRAAIWLTDAVHTPILLEPLDGSLQSMPGDINEAGVAVGYTMYSYGLFQATRWENDAVHTPSALPTWPGYNMSEASVIDPSGTIVLGRSALVNTLVYPWYDLESRIVMWKDGTVWDVNQQLDASGAGWTVRWAHDANAEGWIAATARTGSVDHAVLLVPVPDVAGVAPTSRAAGIELASPWPNPARGAVRVAFTLSRAGAAVVRVLDAQGRVVAVPFAGEAGAGRNELAWDGRASNGREAAPGLYFVTLDSGAAHATTRLVRVQ